MATTFIRGEKVYKGHTRAYTIHTVLKYVFNSDKTENGKLVMNICVRWHWRKRLRFWI